MVASTDGVPGRCETVCETARGRRRYSREAKREDNARMEA